MISYTFRSLLTVKIDCCLFTSLSFLVFVILEPLYRTAVQEAGSISLKVIVCGFIEHLLCAANGVRCQG